MAAKIVTKSNSCGIANWITNVLPYFPSNLIRLEGFCGSGKTTIGRKLSEAGVGVHIEADNFAVKPTTPAPYAQCLKQKKLDDAIALAMQTGRTVILDGVCLEEVAPMARWGRGLLIYVKRLSFNSVDPVWHPGWNLEDDVPVNEPDRSVFLYHLKVRPHMKADLIVEFPEDGHQLPNVPFSRERCFDPANSVVRD